MDAIAVCRRLSAAAYARRPRVPGWRLQRDVEDVGPGVRMWVSTSGDRSILAFRGTADWRTVVDDLLLLHGRVPLGWSSARRALTSALTSIGPGCELMLTGHSIGGAYAQALAAEHGFAAITFNAPGMLQALRRALRPTPPWLQPDHPHILNVCADADWIWRLSGPGLGRVQCAPGARPPTACPVPPGPGPRGVLRALWHGLSSDAGLRSFLRRSLEHHGLGQAPPERLGSCSECVGP